MNGARVQGGHAEAEKEEVKVEDDRVLQIRREKSHEQKEKGTHGTVWSVATGSGKFMRKFRLPENARVDLVKMLFLQVSLLKLRDFKDRKFMGTTRRA
ncbi:hypothetical protein C3L33_00922, partial [Rhododendron williamsianum]